MSYNTLFDRKCRRIVLLVGEIESFWMSVAFHSVEMHLKAKIILDEGRKNEAKKPIQCEGKL